MRRHGDDDDPQLRPLRVDACADVRSVGRDHGLVVGAVGDVDRPAEAGQRARDARLALRIDPPETAVEQLVARRRDAPKVGVHALLIRVDHRLRRGDRCEGRQVTREVGRQRRRPDHDLRAQLVDGDVAAVVVLPHCEHRRHPDQGEDDRDHGIRDRAAAHDQPLGPLPEGDFGSGARSRHASSALHSLSLPSARVSDRPAAARSRGWVRRPRASTRSRCRRRAGRAGLVQRRPRCPARPPQRGPRRPAR